MSGRATVWGRAWEAVGVAVAVAGIAAELAVILALWAVGRRLECPPEEDGEP